MPLTDTAIRNAKPTEKAQKLFDGGGLYLEVAPSGGKWWRLKYRFGGKEKRISLGVYPDVGLKEARERRGEARKLLANDIDPGENRKVQKAAKVERTANSFEAIAREWFAKHSPGWATSHADKIIQRLEKDVFPWLGGRPIAEINAPELLTVLRRIEARGALDTAHRAHQRCEAWSEAKPAGRVVPGSPSAGRVLDREPARPATGRRVIREPRSATLGSTTG